MKKGIFVLAVIPAALALHGCGGGAAGGSNADRHAENMVVDAGPNQSVMNNNGVVFVVSGIAKNENRTISSMNWVVKKGPTNTQTTISIGNADCASTTGSSQANNEWKDIKGCAATVTLGSIPNDEEIILMLTATDSDGKSRSDDVSITASASAGALVADAGADLNVPAGSEVKTGCSYTGGVWFNPQAKTPAFRWDIMNGNELQLAGNTFAISWDTKTGDLTANAPQNVNKQFGVDLACVVTDEAGNVATDLVRYTVQSTPPLVASAGVAQTVVPGVKVDLDASGTTDPANLGLPMYYHWTQLSGTSVVLDNANAVKASFTSPNVNETESMVFQVAVSRDVITANTAFATTEQAQTSVRVLGDADRGALVVTASNAQVVETNTAVSLSASVTDPSGGTGPFYYQWVQISGATVTLTNASTANPSFVAPSVDADLVFEVRVSREPITDTTVYLTTEKAQTSVAVRAATTP